MLDLDGKPRTVTDANGNTTTFVYHGPERDGRLKQKITPPTTAAPTGMSTTYDYDANGNVTSVTDNLGRVTLTSYDELNRPTRVVGPVYTDPVYGPSRPVTRSTYDTLGRLTQVAAGHTDTSGTNPAADVVATQMTAAYDDFGRKLTDTDPLSRAWHYTYDVYGNPASALDPQGQLVSATYGYGHQLLTQTAQGPAGPALVALRRGIKSATVGYVPLYRGGMCVGPGGTCGGGDAWTDAGYHSIIGYMRTTPDANPVQVYQGTCYGTPTGGCTGWGLTTAATGAALGYLTAVAPDPQSAAAPFVQSGGILLQGLTGLPPTAYLWATPPVPNTPYTDHLYETDGTVHPDYADEGVTAYLHQNPDAGTVAVTRYVNTAGEHYYSSDGSYPPGYTFDKILGYVDSAPGAGLVPLARHANLSAGDYLLDTTTTPPAGYTYQAPPLGYWEIGDPAVFSVSR